jgi:hypothetical protein
MRTPLLLTIASVFALSAMDTFTILNGTNFSGIAGNSWGVDRSDQPLWRGERQLRRPGNHRSRRQPGVLAASCPFHTAPTLR